MTTTTTTTTTFEDVRACRVPWCQEHTAPLEAAHDLGDGWIRDPNEPGLVRMHVRPGRFFDLQQFEDDADVSHVMSAPTVDAVERMVTDTVDDMRACAAELLEFADIAAESRIDPA